MENVKKTLIFLSLLLIILIITLIFLLSNRDITAQVIAEQEYSFTKAICKDNTCVDYTITCQGNKVLSIIPVSEPVELPENWKDPRNQEDIDKLCK